VFFEYIATLGHLQEFALISQNLDRFMAGRGSFVVVFASSIPVHFEFATKNGIFDGPEGM